MRRLLTRLKRLLRLEPPYEEPAVVRRRPRVPLGSGGVALDLPEEPHDTDARSRDQRE